MFFYKHVVPAIYMVPSTFALAPPVLPRTGERVEGGQLDGVGPGEGGDQKPSQVGANGRLSSSALTPAGAAGEVGAHAGGSMQSVLVSFRQLPCRAAATLVASCM